MKRHPGVFVVIEGGDGSGKTTLAALLVRHLRAQRIPVVDTGEPSRGPVGVLLRHLQVEGLLAPEVMALLYAADRTQHTQDVILPALARGDMVVSARYLLSSLAYQGPQVGMDRVMGLNDCAVTPDLVLYLDVPPGAALARAAAARAPDVFERPAVAAAVAEGYRRGLALLERDGVRVARLDGTRDVQALLHEALEHVTLFTPGMAPGHGGADGAKR